MSTRFRIVPCSIGGCKFHWEIQSKHWFWGWLYVTFADSLPEAEKQIMHLKQEPKYYG